MKQIAIIHYNTPELTETCIMSIRKVGCDWPITVLDNSDKRPFNKRMKLVKVLNNRKQQLVNFDAELEKYPDKCWDMAKKSNWGSVKHMMSVQYLWSVLKDGFILVESDVLITKPFDFLWNEQYAACGKAQWFRGRRIEKDRLLPWLCYMNVPLLTANGAKYYDPARSWGLQPGGMKNPKNWYDTGAPLLEDIIKTKPQLTARLYPNLDKYYIHYCGGSWRGNDMKEQAEWMKKNEEYWEHVDNSDAKIFVCTHADFKHFVKNEVYEVIDSRDGGDSFNGVPGPFYSELLHMYRVSKRKTLPNYIGFCHYRKYFYFLDAVPSISKNIERHGAIVAAPVNLGMDMHQQWGTWGNIEDLDLATEIVNEKYPELGRVWNANLQKKSMHPGSLHIMKREDWLEMVACAWDVANEFLKRIGGDIDKRINENPKKYHIGEMEFTDLLNERRVGGNICERVVSAWIDWKYPNALQIPMVITAKKIIPNDVKSKKK